MQKALLFSRKALKKPAAFCQLLFLPIIAAIQFDDDISLVTGPAQDAGHLCKIGFACTGRKAVVRGIMVAHMDMPKIFPRQPEHLHRFLPCAQRLFQVDHESGVRDCTYHLGKELGLSAVEARHVFLAYLHTVLTAHLQ